MMVILLARPLMDSFGDADYGDSYIESIENLAIKSVILKQQP